MLLFANTMAYGLFFVYPGILVLLGVGIAWLNSSARRAADSLVRRPWSVPLFLTTLWLPLLARASVVITAIIIAYCSLNEPAEGDAPLQPLGYYLLAMLTWSALVAFVFAAGHLYQSRRARLKRTAHEDDSALSDY